MLPFIYVIAATTMDFALFIFIGVGIPPFYLLSIMLLVGVALLTSLIPNRIVQLLIFGLLMFVQLLTTIGNLIAYFNLKEILMIETVTVIKNILLGADVVKYAGVGHFITLGIIMVAFLASSIVATVMLRKSRAGYTLRGAGCFSVAGIVAISSIYGSLGIMDKSNKMSNLERLTDPIYSLSNFSNRPMALFSFGSPLFYLNNVFAMLGWKSMSSSPVSAHINLIGNDDDYYDNYEHKLGTDKNIIMIMLETFELAGIDEYLTPNLYEIQNMSTWVDGYYAIERTHTTEYVSLVGSYALGEEMWRDYTSIELPQSLPNIFRRSWERDNVGTFQIAGFHNYYLDVYNRDLLFKRNRNGMDWIKGRNSYGLAVDPAFGMNSDTEFVTAALDEIVPSDVDQFFSYVLPISTHGPHFESEVLTSLKYESSRLALSNDPALIALGYADGLEYYKETYPKLTAPSSQLRDAVYAYLIGLKEIDSAVGLILDKLKQNAILGKPHNLTDTALVLYSDHFNYPVYDNEIFGNRGGLLTNHRDEPPTGEKCAFMLYNPTDTAALAGGRKIETFMANTDIYKTVCHLFNIKTDPNFTLGSSILDRIDRNLTDPTTYEISAGVGLYNTLFFGTDLENPNIHFSTRDYKRYTTHGGNLSTLSKMAYRNRMERYASTFIKLRSYYDGNKFRRDPRCNYVIAN